MSSKPHKALPEPDLGDFGSLDESSFIPRESVIVTKPGEEVTVVAQTELLAETVSRSVLPVDAFATIRDLYVDGHAERALQVAAVVAADFDDGQAEVGVTSGLRPAAERKPPRLLLTRANVDKLRLEPQALTVIEQIDGSQMLEEIIEHCPFPAIETLATIDWLCSLNIVTFD